MGQLCAWVWMCVGLVVWLPALAQTEFAATLTQHAVLPANTFIPAPSDAPPNLKTSGKFTTGKRVQELGSVPGLSSGRPTGVGLPFQGQPIQGHSGIQRMKDGTFWILTDNGAGTKANSADFMLHLNHYQVDFNTHQFQRLETIFLHDPDQKVPFHIVTEGTDKRYLTGADFDPESFQITHDALWIGDEFGPFLIQADLTGKVLAIYETQVEGRVVRSPDHPSLTTPSSPQDALAFEVRRSKGFEGMAASKDGKKLYALLEGALWDNQTQAYEMHNAQHYLRVLEFDIQTKNWTGRHWKYPLEANHHAIGDFNMIDETTGLIIERDNGEGVAAHRCTQGKKPDCFHDLPKFKRVYKVEMNDANVNGLLRKVSFIDLLNIADPHHVSHKPLDEGVFKFPFFTIENVDVIDDHHIIVGNDNNLPFSSSRQPNQADDNELVILFVGDFLKVN